MPIGEEGQHLRLAGAERWISPLDRRADAGSHPFALLRRSDVLDLTDEVQRQGLHLGGYGNDSIDGGSGTDVRIGGPGADTFSTCETQRERCQPPAGVGAPAEQVDEDGRVEEDGRQLPDPPPISTPLIANPLAGILIPLVTAVGDRAERRVDRLPALVVVERAFDCPRDVRAPAAGTDAAVELANDLVAEGYVYSQGHTLRHVPQRAPRQPARRPERNAPRLHGPRPRPGCPWVRVRR
jgi:hypothetical protein